jgi:hypothetical protein
MRIAPRCPHPRRFRAAFGALALATVPLGACREPAGPRWSVQVGIVDFERSAVQAFTLPQTVRVGVPFGVTVTTAGSPDCVRPAGARVGVTGLDAEIVPLDAMAPPATACQRNRGVFPRTVQVRFDAAGEAVVRVRARDTHLREAVLEAAVRVEP